MRKACDYSLITVDNLRNHGVGKHILKIIIKLKFRIGNISIYTRKR